MSAVHALSYFRKIPVNVTLSSGTYKLYRISTPTPYTGCSSGKGQYPGTSYIVSVILSKNVHMNMCPIPNGFRDRAIWMYNRKIVDNKEILRVRTVSNTGIYCSSDRVGTVYNKPSKIPPSSSMHFASRVKTWCVVVRLSASWRSFMQTITSSTLTSSSSRVSTSSNELQSALILTVEFLNIYYKLYQLCHLNNKYRY